MADDHTLSVSVKRTSKKESGYVLESNDGELYIAAAPAKARVNVGDKVVGINGIKASEFEDEEDANACLETIRIVVVPEAQIDDYENAENNQNQPSGGGAPTPRGANSEPANSFGPKCGECGHVNEDLERDEDGDLVCEECGYVIPEETAVVPQEGDPKSEYPCPDCGHITINPEPDDEGDRICEECGCILAEKVIVPCDECGFENVDPTPNEDGEYACQNCGAPIEAPAQEKSAAEKLTEMTDAAAGDPAAEGQEFDESGKPVTNQDGKKLTPADMFKPGDVITVTVGKSNPKQDAGLKLEQKENGKYYVRKVPSSGLFARTPVIAGDKLLELNGKDSKEYEDLGEMKDVLKDEERITVVVLRMDPDDTESSADTIDYDNLAPITPDGEVIRDDISDKDDDTAGYDGNDCGCVWCPDCHP